MESALIGRDEYEALEHCVYLNQASLGLIPRRSTEAMVRLLEDVAQQGNLRLSDTAEAAILDSVRAAAAGILDAPDESIAIVGGASEALGQLANMLATPEGEAVLVATDFPSLTYPWLGAHERIGTPIAWVEDLPERDLTATLIAAIGERTSVVCFSAVQFATGTLVDVAAVVRRAHEVGAKAIVDVTQMAGAAPVSMRAWGADALVCSGYKWLSSHGGVAVLAIGEAFLDGPPPLVGWKGTDDPFDLRPQDLALAEDARRFELSTIAYSSAAGLETSIGMLTEAGIEAIDARAAALAAELVAAVEPHGWVPFRSLDSPAASSHIVSLRHAQISFRDAQASLAARQIITTARGGGVRVSLHGYNDSSDVAALADALGALASA